MNMTWWECKRDRPINVDKKCDKREEVDCNEGDKLENMIYDVEENFMDRPKILDNLKNDAETLLYVGYFKFTRLSAVLRLYN